MQGLPREHEPLINVMLTHACTKKVRLERWINRDQVAPEISAGLGASPPALRVPSPTACTCTDAVSARAARAPRGGSLWHGAVWGAARAAACLVEAFTVGARRLPRACARCRLRCRTNGRATRLASRSQQPPRAAREPPRKGASRAAPGCFHAKCGPLRGSVDPLAWSKPRSGSVETSSGAQHGQEPLRGARGGRVTRCSSTGRCAARRAGSRGSPRTRGSPRRSCSGRGSCSARTGWP